MLRGANMKIAKDRLKEIIKEELEISMQGHDEMQGGSYKKDPDGYEGHMAKTNLFKIAEYAQEMHELIHDDENLEPWVEEKIAVAAHMMDAVGHYMQYIKHRGHEDAEGEAGHADLGGKENEDEEFVMDEETEFEEGSEE